MYSATVQFVPKLKTVVHKLSVVEIAIPFSDSKITTLDDGIVDVEFAAMVITFSAAPLSRESS